VRDSIRATGKTEAAGIAGTPSLYSGSMKYVSDNDSSSSDEECQMRKTDQLAESDLFDEKMKKSLKDSQRRATDMGNSNMIFSKGDPDAVSEGTTWIAKGGNSYMQSEQSTFMVKGALVPHTDDLSSQSSYMVKVGGMSH
jgi:hypothetical protein